ncbi:MAG TPA: TIGR03032 family protein [Patescibacteria group bacterium]|nr:TIGR03032 family protein [Patescibacteria group bacterium]
MRLDTPFIRLPLHFDAERLALEIGALPESAWKRHPHGYAGNFAVPLIAAHGDPANDQTRGEMLPTPHLRDLPYIRQVMAALQAPIGRTRLMRIDGNGEATRHVDSNYYWQTHLRIHVPILTTPEVAFLCGDARVHMRAGECWIFDTWSAHNVLNPDPTRRVHLVIDSVGSDAFWELVDAGDRPTEFHPPAFANPRLVAFDPDVDVMPRHERFNQPMVMTPGEVAHWFRLAEDEARTSATALPDAARALSRIANRFQRHWSAAYAEYGPDPRGHVTYRLLLRELDAALQDIPAQFTANNGTQITEILRQMIVRVALNPELGGQYQRAEALLPAPVASEASKPSVATAPAENARRRFNAPVFIVSPPRSGSSLLFETLVQSPSAWSIGGESHRVIEQIPSLNPSAVNFDSNRITADKATPMTVAELTHGFFGQARDRDGHPARADATDLRFIEKTPKNALRVPFFASAYPDARFILLYRDPRDVLSSMLDAWRSKRFVTYPKLPDWRGDPWSLLLTPGWRDWIGLPLHEVVAKQWCSVVEALLDDLGDLDPARFAIADYTELVRDPGTELQRLSRFAGLDWDRDLGPLPPSRHTLTPPAADKWKRNESELADMLPMVQSTAERLRDFVDVHRPRLPVAGLPVTAATDKQGPATAAMAVPSAASPRPASPPVEATLAFNSVFTGSMPGLLAETGGTLMVTTYQSGRAILVRNDNGSLNTHFKAFHSPMGVASRGDLLALATGRSVIEFHDQKNVATSLPPAGRHDACFLPRRAHYTGDIRIHEIGYAGDELWIVNTRFSCLATLDDVHNFVPRWRPKFISALEASDRCHLNGMCIIDDRVRYVTALAETDTAAGWREHKATGGLLIDVASNEIVARGLSMPHSPRWYDGRMWVLESGKGTLSTIDLASGQITPVCELPGFTRGLAFHGHHAFIGLSQIRESVFGGLPIVERLSERLCGIWAVDLRSGKIAGFLRFEGSVQEIFDVQLLAGLRFPELFEPEDERNAGAFVLPNRTAA